MYQLGRMCMNGTGTEPNPKRAAPGVEIETLMKRVSAAVGEKTGQKQEPERLSRLKSEFYFVPAR
jgi:hypothetical protein